MLHQCFKKLKMYRKKSLRFGHRWLMKVRYRNMYFHIFFLRVSSRCMVIVSILMGRRCDESETNDKQTIGTILRNRIWYEVENVEPFPYAWSLNLKLSRFPSFIRDFGPKLEESGSLWQYERYFILCVDHKKQQQHYTQKVISQNTELRGKFNTESP